MGDTTIEWTDKVWNPVTGCSKVSEGCRNCYAERVFPRAYGDQRIEIGGESRPRTFADIVLHRDRLDQPLHWKKPSRIFVNSMSDLFHEAVPDFFIEDVWAVMMASPWHTFQILTKRPERMKVFLENQDWERVGRLVVQYSHKAAYLALECKARGERIMPHIWLGVSVEDQKTADERIPLLRKTSAAVRFISVEPLLGQINLCLSPGGVEIGINWVIVGGESGSKARPMHPDWARSIRDQCQAGGVLFFFKQWGEWEPVAPIYDEDDKHIHRVNRADPDRCVVLDRMGLQWPEFQPPPGTWMMERVGKKAAGRLLDGREWSDGGHAKLFRAE